MWTRFWNVSLVPALMNAPFVYLIICTNVYKVIQQWIILLCCTNSSLQIDTVLLILVHMNFCFLGVSLTLQQLSSAMNAEAKVNNLEKLWPTSITDRILMTWPYICKSQYVLFLMDRAFSTAVQYCLVKYLLTLVINKFRTYQVKLVRLSKENHWKAVWEPPECTIMLLSIM